MKLLSITASCLVVFIILASATYSQDEGHTFISSGKGPRVCLGRWVQPDDVAKSGYCEGEVMGLSQYSALSSRKTVDRLDQLLIAISAIDEKIAENNNQLGMLIQATENTKASIDSQVAQVGEILRETISKRFDTLLVQLINDDLFKEELVRLKEEILEEIDYVYFSQPPVSEETDTKK